MMHYTNQGHTLVTESAMTAPIPACPYVLVIDDEPSISSIIVLTLEMEGHAGLSISDSLDVLPFLHHARDKRSLPAVILLDLMMPGLSGYDLAAQLSRDPSYAHIPIIIMTADYRVHSAHSIPGAADLLCKPFFINTLLDKIEHYLLPLEAIYFKNVTFAAYSP